MYSGHVGVDYSGQFPWGSKTNVTRGSAHFNEKPPVEKERTPSTPTSISLRSSRSTSHPSSSTVAKLTTNVLARTLSLLPHALATKRPQTQKHFCERREKKGEESNYERGSGRILLNRRLTHNTVRCTRDD